MAIKLGTENKKQVAIAASLGFVVLILAVKMLFFSGEPSPAAPVPTAAAPSSATSAAPAPPSVAPPRVVTHPAVVPPAAGVHQASKVAPSGANLDPTLHFEWMAQTESLEYTGRGRNIFSMTSAPLDTIPVVKGPIRPEPPPPVADVPTGPPPPPPVDLKFFGYSARKSGDRKAFLLRGDDVFIAAEGDVVDHRYKVVKISPFSVQIEDLPYNNTQTVGLTPN